MLANLIRQPQLPETDLGTLRWLVHLRVRIALVLLLVLAAVNLIEPLPPETSAALIATDLVYLLFGSLYAYLLKERPASSFSPAEARISFVRNAQLPEKLALCTLAVYFSGGVLTPSFLLYSLAVIEAIILMEPRGVYRTGTAAVALFGVLTVLESLRIIPHFTSYFGSRDFYSIAVPSTYALHMIFVACLLMLSAYIGSRVAHLISHRNTLIESRLKDLRTLYSTANGLGKMMDEDAVLSYLATTLKESQGASMCLIALLDKEGHAEIKASVGATRELLQRIRDIRSTPEGLERVLRDGEPLLVEDLGNYPELQLWGSEGTSGSACLYPIKSEGRVLGVIALLFVEKVSPDPEYHDLLSTVASQAGVAIERARSMSDAQRMAREMSALYDVGLQMGSTLSVAEIMRRTSDHIERLMRPDLYYIALYNEETETITFETVVENGATRPRTRLSAQGGGPTALIIKSREPLLVQNWLEHGERYNAIAQRSGRDMLSYLGVPMLLDDRVVGVLSVQCARANAFSAEDQGFLSAMAAQTAMALANARLHEEVRAQAMFDSLTQVYNHGCFVEKVREAVEASDRNDSHVALIMLDIDHFKKYNDTYGHVAGDNVLKLVASALKESTGEGGYVGRWGGEEFGVLITGATVGKAKATARRIRRVISELYPVDGHGHAIPGPTVSQGLSVYPFPSATASELIENADAALYNAKDQGRNQLVVFEAGGRMRESTVTTGDLSLPRFTVEAKELTGPLARRHPSTTDHLEGKAPTRH
jgi:diguanylate cyclase (GGDEF)-like protein